MIEKLKENKDRQPGYPDEICHVNRTKINEIIDFLQEIVEPTGLSEAQTYRHALVEINKNRSCGCSQKSALIAAVALNTDFGDPRQKCDVCGERTLGTLLLLAEEKEGMGVDVDRACPQCIYNYRRSLRR